MSASKKADLIVDLQYGSTGKGLIAGFLAEMNKYDTVVSANMPNAGHTYINSAGRKWVHKVLPNGIVSPKLKRVMIGPGSIFNLSRLLDELKWSADLLRGAYVIIHKDAMIVTNNHADREKSAYNHVASTMQGSAEAMIDKIRRDPNNDYRICQSLCTVNMGTDFPLIIADQHTWLQHLYQSEKILIEGAQGYSLGLNAGFWPHCTSRDCTPARFMADCGVPHKMLKQVIGTARMHPIRVGNVKGGYSGGHYDDQREITWEDIGVEPERTTVTGRVRRVFTFSSQQIRDAIMACQPDLVFLNFCNYDKAASDWVISIIQNELNEHVPGSAVRFLGWGPSFDDVEICYREQGRKE